jgi:hypothetical protein
MKKEEVKKYTKKPVMIEAIKWTGDNLFDIITFTDGRPDLTFKASSDGWEKYERIVEEEGFKIKTLEGYLNVTIGSYIIKGIKGEFYACKPDIFHMTYEEANTK